MTCVRTGTLTGSWEPWSLVYADGSTAVARRPDAKAGGRGEQPAYPDDQTEISTGECRHGWIMFAVPAAPVAGRTPAAR